MKNNMVATLFRLASAAALFVTIAPGAAAADFTILQPLGDKPMQTTKGALPKDGYDVPTTPQTARWGHLPNAEAKPVLSVPSGSVVTFDTVSHEGVNAMIRKSDVAPSVAKK